MSQTSQQVNQDILKYAIENNLINMDDIKRQAEEHRQKRTLHLQPSEVTHPSMRGNDDDDDIIPFGHSPKVPVWEKQNLTVKEAAIYSNIGINRLNIMLDEANCPFRLQVGRKRLIKRKLFDKYIESKEII